MTEQHRGVEVVYRDGARERFPNAVEFRLLDAVLHLAAGDDEVVASVPWELVRRVAYVADVTPDEPAPPLNTFAR